jgi:hypothetical protein
MRAEGGEVCGGVGENTEVEADQRERRVEEGSRVWAGNSCASAATKGDSGTSSNASSRSSSSAHASSTSTSISSSSTFSYTAVLTLVPIFHVGRHPRRGEPERELGRWGEQGCEAGA